MGVARRRALVAVVTGLCLAGCGSSGPRPEAAPRACKLDIGGTLAAELPDGSLVVGAASHRGPKLVVRLRRVTRGCRVVRSFGTHGTATVEVGANDVGEIDVLRAAPDGRLVLAGGNGKAELVGRLLGDGRLDRSFGDGGWARVASHERSQRGMPPPAPTATSIAFAGSGAILVGGDDEAPHCCVRDFVSEVSEAGVPVRTFGNEGSVFLPTFGGSYTTELGVEPDGSSYALGEYEQSGCGDPSIVRIRRDGSLDTRFDRSIARTVERVSGRKLRFTPTLVPGESGAFALVGGLDKTCVPAFPPPRVASGGIAVEVGPSGGVERETRFPAPGYAFDNPAAIRLVSGRVVAAALVYRANGKVKSALVRLFRPDGMTEGVRAVALTSLPRSQSPSLALVPAAGGDAWLVVGLATQTDLVPVRVGG